MVNRFFLVCAFLALSAVEATASELELDLNNTNIEMGKFILAKLSYFGEKDPGFSNLSSWETDLHVDRRDREVTQFDKTTILVTEVIRLYPRKTGIINLPPIALGGAMLVPQTIHVSPAIRDGINGLPTWQLSDQNVWRDQAFTLSVTAALFHPSNKIKIDTPEVAGIVFGFRQQHRHEVNGVTTVTVSWQAHAQRKGDFHLNLPPIEQRGRGRHKFYLPVKALIVKPVPAYLPPTVLIGSPEVTTTLSGNTWQIQIANRGILPSQLYGVTRNLADIAYIGVDNIEQRINNNNGVAYHDYQTTLPNWAFGEFSRHYFELPYFDTAQGKLHHHLVVLPSLWRVPSWFMILLGLIALAMITFIAKFALSKSAEFKYRKAFNEAESSKIKREILLDHSQQDSLTEWAKNPDKALKLSAKQQAELAQRLNIDCFRK